MTQKPIAPRPRAARDVQEAADWYADEAGEKVALEFLDAVENAYRAISRSPSTGSPRYAHELDFAGLRTRSLRRFPYLIFYVEQPEQVEIWRVLHGRRDIPASMGESDN